MTVDLTADSSPLVTLLRERMDARGWSMRQLARESGIPIATVSYTLRHAGRTIPEQTWLPLAEALDIPLRAARRAADADAPVWQLPARANRLSPAGRRALLAHLDFLLDLEDRR